MRLLQAAARRPAARVHAVRHRVAVLELHAARRVLLPVLRHLDAHDARAVRGRHAVQRRRAAPRRGGRAAPRTEDRVVAAEEDPAEACAPQVRGEPSGLLGRGRRHALRLLLEHHRRHVEADFAAGVVCGFALFE